MKSQSCYKVTFYRMGTSVTAEDGVLYFACDDISQVPKLFHALWGDGSINGIVRIGTVWLAEA